MRFDIDKREVVMVGVGDGRVRLVGPLTVWDPPVRLAFRDERGTEVEVNFSSLDLDRTRVVLEHRGLDRLPPDDARNTVQYGWRRLAFQFESYMAMPVREETR